jgi:DNA polymerase eta
MGQILLEGRVWPCQNISLSVSGFEDAVSNNMGIGAFLVKGDEAKLLNANSRVSSVAPTVQDRPDKRRRVDVTSGIHKFLVKTETSEEHEYV